MKNSIILGLISLLALSAVGILSIVATPALAAEKSAEDKINKIYEMCDKVIDYYDDYKFGDDKTYKVYKLCEKLVYEIPMYDSYDPYNTSD
jgi:azurin